MNRFDIAFATVLFFFGFTAHGAKQIELPEIVNSINQIEIQGPLNQSYEFKVQRLSVDVVKIFDPKVKDLKSFVKMDGFEIVSKDMTTSFQKFEKHPVVLKPTKKNLVSFSRDSSKAVVFSLASAEQKTATVDLNFFGMEYNLTEQQAKNYFEEKYYLPLEQYAYEEVRKISIGNDFNCALYENQKVKCWGANLHGQLGVGKTHQEDPFELDVQKEYAALGSGEIIDVYSGSYFSCAIFANHRVKCWGNNSYGQLGLGDLAPRGHNLSVMGDSLPYLDLGKAKVIKLGLGFNHACALFDNYKVKCWGANYLGQLGLGDSFSRGDQPNEMGDNLPYVDLGSDEVVDIEVGKMFNCALFITGKIKCWGSNVEGSLGLGHTQSLGMHEDEMGENLPYVDLGPFKVQKFDLGGSHACALLENNELKCWGYNKYGQLGNGTVNNVGVAKNQMGIHLAPVDLGSELVKSIHSTSNHTCARLNNGRIKCWGKNSEGTTLGTGDREHRGDNPGEMGKHLDYLNIDSDSIVNLNVGYYHNCVLYQNGRVKCWGFGEQGELGLLGDYETKGDEPGEMGDALRFAYLGMKPF